MKTFRKWSTAEVVEEFNLHRDLENQYLESWMQPDTTPTAFDQQTLNYLQMRLNDRVYAWNEQDLATNFIGPILSLVDFNHSHYHSFRERELSVSYKEERLYSIVDLVVANGDFTPKRPYFFLNEKYTEEYSMSKK